VVRGSVKNRSAKKHGFLDKFYHAKVSKTDENLNTILHRVREAAINDIVTHHSRFRMANVCQTVRSLSSISPIEVVLLASGSDIGILASCGTTWSPSPRGVSITRS
jgi:hypothetical protein